MSANNPNNNANTNNTNTNSNKTPRHGNHNVDHPDTEHVYLYTLITEEN